MRKTVRWQQERSEGFVSDLQGRDIQSSAKALVSNTGKIKALQFKNQANLGSWLSNFGIYVPTKSTCRTLTTLYDIAFVSFEVTGVVTNTPAVDAYRGAGRPEANYMMERLMDKIAFDLKLDRIEVRKANLIQPEQIPYKTVCSGTIDSGDMPALFNAALKNADVSGFNSFLLLLLLLLFILSSNLLIKSFVSASVSTFFAIFDEDTLAVSSLVVGFVHCVSFVFLL